MFLISLLYSWIPVLLWAAAIFIISDIPALDSGLGLADLVLRKIAHVVEFSVLTGLLVRALKRTWKILPLVSVISWAVFLAFLYAVSDEVHQGFVPGRGPAVMDVLIDGVGIMLAGVWLKK